MEILRQMIKPYSNHWCVQSVHRFVPAEAAQRELAGNVVRKCPLRQIHDVWRFINSYHPVHGAGCQKKTLVLRTELNVGHTSSRIYEVCTTNPTLHWCHRGSGLFADCLFPDRDGAIERAGGQHLTEFWMSPGQAPYGARVGFPARRHRPDAFVVLVPNLTV